jgi:putative Holliday junction resolvase
MKANRILGLDVGTKTIGIAIGYVRTELSDPLFTLQRQSVKKDVVRILQVCKKHAIEHVVVGLPFQLDGTEGRSAKLARQIGTAIVADGSYGVSYFDERFSTVEASRRLRESGKNSRDQKSIIDQAAAMVIVEDWIRSQSN